MPEAGNAAAAAIVVAGGTGERFGAPGGKQLALVAGLPVLAHTLLALDRVPGIVLLVVVCHPASVAEFQQIALDPIRLETPHVLVGGGPTRADSVRNGLSATPLHLPYIVVHDGARPLVTSATVSACLAALTERPDAAGVVVGHPSYDTLKEVESARILSTPDRSRFWAVQTPQVFRAGALRAAYAGDSSTGPATDDASLLERSGGTVLVIEGPRDNIKVTVPEDLAIVDAVLRHREGGV